MPGAGWAAVPGETGVPGGIEDGTGCRVAPAPGCTGLALLTWAAFWLQKSISPFEGVAAKAAPVRVPAVRMPVPSNRPYFMEDLL